MEMKRTLRFAIAVVALLGLSAAANAAVVNIAADASSYAPGDTITITITTDAQGAALDSAFIQVLFNSALVTPGTATQSPGPAGWFTQDPNLLDTPGFKTAVSQFAFPANNPGTSIGSVITFTADNAGTAVF